MGLRESEMTEQLSLHFANNQRMAATSVIIKPYLHIQGIKGVQGRLASSFFFYSKGGNSCPETQAGEIHTSFLI